MTAPLDPETKRLRKLLPGALADEALALKMRIDAIKDEAIRRGLKSAEGEAARITLSPPGTQNRTDRAGLLKVLAITEAEFTARFTSVVKTDWRMTVTPRRQFRQAHERPRNHSFKNPVLGCAGCALVSGNPYYWSPHWHRLRGAALARDGGRCTVAGCAAPATTVDHIIARPRGVAVPCPADRLDNLRSLCTTHDVQIKEDASGQRRRGGRPVLRGCDADGWPLGASVP